MTESPCLAVNNLVSHAEKSSRGNLPRQLADALRPHAGIIAVLVFATCFLSPMLWTSFYFDDVKNACTPGHLRVLDKSLVKLFLDCTRGAMHSGRFFPGALGITFLMHDIFTNALAYKACLLVLTLSNLLEFYALLRCWKVSRATAQLGTLALVLLIQMRAFADPLLSFAGILQFVVGQLLLSMIFLQKHLDSGRGKWLAWSVAIYVSSLMTYEISYMFLPIYAVAAYAHLRQWRPTLSVMRPYIYAVVLLTTLVLGLRFNVHMPEDFPYRFRLAPQLVAATALKQASAALPLSYALLSLHHPLYFDAWRALGRWDSWAMALFASGLTWLFVQRIPTGRTARSRPAIGLLFVAGALVWFLPGLPISASPKYQACVEVGLGYLPVYVQYCGVALLIVACVSWFVRRVPAQRGKLAFVLMLANAGVALFSFDTNRHVVGIQEASPSIRERRILEAALDAGLGDRIPEGATIMTSKGTPLGVLRCGPPVASSFVSQHLHRRVNAVSGIMWPNERPLSVQLDGLPLPTFIMRWNSGDGHSGYVLLGSIDPETTEDLEAENFDTRRFRIFVKGTPTTPAGGRAPDAQYPDMLQLTLLRRGPDWALYEGCLPQAVDVAKVEMNVVSAALCRAGDVVEKR